MIINFKSNRVFLLDIFKTFIIPVFSGICFIVWLFFLFQQPILVFPTIFLIFIVMYIFSGSVFGGMTVAFAVSAGIFAIATTEPFNKILLICEILWLILVFIEIEKYRQRWIAEK